MPCGAPFFWPRGPLESRALVSFLVYNLVIMTTVTLSEAKAQLARLMKELERLGEPIVITRSGHPAGVLLPVEEYEGLLETLEVLADDELSSALRAGLEDVAAGRVIEHDEVWRELEPSLRR